MQEMIKSTILFQGSGCPEIQFAEYYVLKCSEFTEFCDEDEIDDDKWNVGEDFIELYDDEFLCLGNFPMGSGLLILKSEFVSTDKHGLYLSGKEFEFSLANIRNLIQEFA